MPFYPPNCAFFQRLIWQWATHTTLKAAQIKHGKKNWTELKWEHIKHWNLALCIIVIGLYVWFPSHSCLLMVWVTRGVSSHSGVVSPLCHVVIFLEGFPTTEWLKTRNWLIGRTGTKPVFLSNRHTDRENNYKIGKPTLYYCANVTVTCCTYNVGFIPCNAFF